MTRTERQNLRAEKQRTQAWQLVGPFCRECGRNHKLEFHHIDPTAKEFNVAQMFGRLSWGRIQAELEKCTVLCRDCHETTFADTMAQLRSA